MLFFLITTFVQTVLGDDSSEDDGDGRVSVGAIVAAGVVGVFIVLVVVLLCFHECCTKPKRTVKPQRISVVGLSRHTGPPSRVIPTAPPMHSSGMCPVDPPPYRPYDDPYETQQNQSSNLFSRQLVSHTTRPSRFERHPPPVMPCTPLPNIERHQRTSDPPPYSG
ncbi:uncharacterized protein LOC127703086 [Mytilus californianus]|uniref:uncharacterized protein LOC127703086 n=1 Tax=Mytilus californianus TaxID=6549 RepID=UPI00224641FB|nr:uncharacterized protein LOC127703086 [Mytilus californianus]